MKASLVVVWTRAKIAEHLADVHGWRWVDCEFCDGDGCDECEGTGLVLEMRLREACGDHCPIVEMSVGSG